MAKTTLIFIFSLAIIATLLIGINIGKNLNLSSEELASSTSPTLTLVPSQNPSPTIAKTVTGSGFIESKIYTTKEESSTTTFTNGSCGFQFSYPGSYIHEQTQNQNSVIFVNPNNQDELIAAFCAENIPRPPVSPENIEAIILDGQPANLYHDQDQKGNPRDEIIVRHPKNGLEIIIAGYGEVFQNVLSSFKFL